MSAVKRIVVCGGNGFLGSRICRAAVARGWDVTSISRSGEPTWSSVTASSTPPSWSHNVTWERADILKPSTYSPLLKSANYVVHSMGILLEADYKGVLSGRESPISGLRRAFSQSKKGTRNPLEDTELKSGERDGQLTYELMNRDSAVTLAREASKSIDLKEGGFVFISAAGGAPILPGRYIATKREAEEIIGREFPGMRSIFVRPGFLYDSSRAVTVPLAAVTGLGAAFNGLTGGVLGGILGAGGVKPLKADVVADAVVEALDGDVRGVVEVEGIEELAGKAWRKSML